MSCKLLQCSVQTHLRRAEVLLAEWRKARQDVTAGGAAYLPLPMVNSALRRGRLHRVAGAAVFTRGIFAVYPVRSDRAPLIEQALAAFAPVVRGRVARTNVSGADTATAAQ